MSGNERKAIILVGAAELITEEKEVVAGGGKSRLISRTKKCRKRHCGLEKHPALRGPNSLYAGGRTLKRHRKRSVNAQASV